MPLLKRKVFEKDKVPEFLRDDEEVFYCEVTNEVFRDYEEFCERITLINSMVWSCTMTGRTNLTYAEALASEAAARRNLADFPSELYAPTLWLASRTQKSGFTDMAEDVYSYVKDRYFVGEHVEASFNEDVWCDSLQVLQVFAPTDEQIATAKKNGIQEQFVPPASLFRYEVEQLDKDDQDSSQVLIVEASQVRRKKFQYTREKNRLFLKQYTEQSSIGVWQVKESVMKKFGIYKLSFDQIFDGPAPDFTNSKKIIKKQETLFKYLTNNTSGQFKDKMNIRNLTEEMKRREEEIKQKAFAAKQKILEEKEREKQKRREENLQISALLREWNKQRDDLELEDHRMLPVPSPVKAKIPSKYFGDVLFILEFVNSFSSILKTEKYCKSTSGLSLEILERALLEHEINGPLTDILKMLLTTIFNRQRAEDAEVTQNSNGIFTEDGIIGSVTVEEAVKHATTAAVWCPKHQGMTLAQLPLEGLMISETLRLHLLGSGSRLKESAARWQYQQRGGYMSTDDPGLALRLNSPHVIRALAVCHVAQLSIGDKLKILVCLIHQILTFADIRDIVDDRLEKSRQIRADFRTLQATERKRESEVLSLKAKLKREAKLKKDEDPNQAKVIDEELENNLNKLKVDNEKKQHEFKENTQKLMLESNEFAVLLGQDRAYRRYIYIDSIPAFFVEHDERNPGVCLERLITPKPELINAPPEDPLQYIRKLFSENGSALNGTNNGLSNVDCNALFPKKNGVIAKTDCDMKLIRDMFMCTGDDSECLVHSTTIEKQKWSFFYRKEDINSLILSLNKRGFREGELKQVLEQCKEYIQERVEECPVEKLNSSIQIEKIALRKSGKVKYENANLGFPPGTELNVILESTLRDYILDLEQQIHSGNLGKLHVPDRNAWRKCLKERDYNLDILKIALTNGTLGNARDADKLSNESRSSTPDVLCPVRDPGRFLPHSIDADSEDSGMESDSAENIPLHLTVQQQAAVTGLATALHTLAHSIDSRYLKQPLGHAIKKSKKKKTKDNAEPQDVLPMWAASLQTATSFAQVLLHYSTLEFCTALEKSALNARCFTCRKSRNDDQLLLCDGCNRGQHLYCIEPKLTSVPVGDWYCKQCQPPEEHINVTRSHRRLFTQESDDENQSNEEEASDGHKDDEESEEAAEDVESTCETCGETVEDSCMQCEKCSLTYHPECLVPPLRRAPRGLWQCAACKQKAERVRRVQQRHVEKDDDDSESSDSSVSSEESERAGSRRCARRARDKIHDFARTLRRASLDSNTSSSEEESSSQISKGPYDRPNTNNTSSGRRSRRAQEEFDDLPLHNASLQTLLADTLKHEDAWPFTQPVLKRDVPDYFEIITHPMDFGTIKYKLNIGKYQYDAELMADAMLVFENCNTYNDSDSAVYKSGVRLLRFFKKRCQELGLPIPKDDNGLHEDADNLEIESGDGGRDDDEDEVVPLKKQRMN